MLVREGGAVIGGVLVDRVGSEFVLEGLMSWRELFKSSVSLTLG